MRKKGYSNLDKAHFRGQLQAVSTGVSECAQTGPIIMDGNQIIEEKIKSNKRQMQRDLLLCFLFLFDVPTEVAT